MRTPDEQTVAHALLDAWDALCRGEVGLRTAVQQHLSNLPHAIRDRTTAELRAVASTRRRLAHATGSEDPALLLAAHRILTDHPHQNALAARLSEEEIESVRGWEDRLPFEVTDPVARFGVRYGLSDAASAVLLAEPDADALATSLLQPPPRTLRTHLQRISRPELAERLQAEGVVTREGAWSEAALIAPAGADVLGTPSWQEGLCDLQDEASQLVARLVAPPPRGSVLDACAGTGGKALAIGDLLADRGRVLALDLSENRIVAARRRARRAGLSNLRFLPTAPERWDKEVETYARKADRILLDLPCSGLGSLRRHPELRWSEAAHHGEALAITQHELVRRAAEVLAPGARLIVVTCTFGDAENRAPIDAVLSADPSLEVVLPKEILGRALTEPLTWRDEHAIEMRPDRHGTDGFFAMVLRRRR